MQDLIQQLINDNYLKTPEIIQAFKKIKRQDFVPSELEMESTGNYPLPIGYGQTISQPLTIAFMMELLALERGWKVLDVGSGSGYTTALFCEIVGKEGKVFAIERIDELRKFGEDNVRKYNFVEEGRAVFITGDGTKGIKKEAPFNAIHVGAAAVDVPEALLDQLSIGGRMVIPLGYQTQEITLIEKITSKRFKEKRFPGFTFVPLIKGLPGKNKI
ncbi:protein-L-isoaspartate O-methyltransferase [bacterium (Candidatus Moisslbacteria) CG12_big_fil_rev_8_21_14_0_65_36_11]|nr:protein-L-isoaspartate O-methyltransferase [Candidatus Kuenenbacteria bacterium]OIP76310.1 MAG: protein-L-isoaspartate O-methyltransferase [Parcubacteria group bacterium CG2_30_36_38]PIV45951.1 MAG: protein-L-isoaspartate O-methyltransferase [bacterium (Candidatus Moisslbacteria) CG02_land_8_20_14_3_00_36_53]PIW68047.1 MAG: protein-L-isoaspartate O-methyltransferase [bacterium (Candidatus Moisslbacteria) CG12_big_fil_rev_8_21_14_0_65_36_11]PIZ90198.1 MAG: protein-L-isoaspartate O-methyltrans